MKAHKYWSLGALACMAGCFYTGCKKLMQAHKYFACGSLICMGIEVISEVREAIDSCFSTI